jgi:hypothetical protein
MIAINSSMHLLAGVSRLDPRHPLDRESAHKSPCVRRSSTPTSAAPHEDEKTSESCSRRPPRSFQFKARLTAATAAATTAAAAFTASAAVAMETAVGTALETSLTTITSGSSVYVPSDVDGDGGAQILVVLVTAVCGMVGMLTSVGGEGAASEEALAEKVATQVAAMGTQTDLVGFQADQLVLDPISASSAFDSQGVLRVDGAISLGTAAALLAEVNATLDRELSRAGGGGLPSDSFGNVYCKGNRYDLKLRLDGAAAAALREAVGRMRPFLASAAGGERARLCEFAALVSDPGSARQPVHPDTNYRRDRCVVTAFVALQEVAADMGPTVFIPGSHTAGAHLSFREAGERGGAALAAPNGVATLGTGDATVFDSRLLHCGGGNSSDRRRVLFYFSFEVDGSDNPNAAVSSIRDELRGKLSLADL